MFEPALLVDVLVYRSVGALLAEVRAVGAEARSQDPAEGEAVTSLTVAGHGSQSGGDPTWLLVHVPVPTVLKGM